jgi:hypothetical protein
MSSGIILTQFAGPCEPSMPIALSAPGAHALCYGPADAASENALVQCFEQKVEAVDLAALPAETNNRPITRFCARLQSDTGPVTEKAPILMMVAFDVPPEMALEVERWYAEEHIPMLMRAPGWLRARRFEAIRSVGPRRYTSIALHDLRDLAVLDSNERALARSTAWRARLEETAWFQQAGRFVYRRIETML